MKIHFKNKYIYLCFSIMGGLCGALVFYYLLFNSSTYVEIFKKFISIIMPVIDGFIVAYVLCPVVNYIETKLLKKFYSNPKFKLSDIKQRKFTRATSITITYLLLIIIITVFIKMIIPELTMSIKSLADNLPDYVNNIVNKLHELLANYKFLDDLIEKNLTESTPDFQSFLWSKISPYLDILNPDSNAISIIWENLSGKLVNGFVFIWNLFMGLMISIYMLVSKETYLAQTKKFLYAVFPDNIANRIIIEARLVHKTFGGFIVGKIVDSAIIGLICLVYCLITRTPYAILVSVVVGITNIVPVLGPYVGAIISFLLIILVDPLKALIFLVFVFILQQFDANYIGPTILGNSTGLSGFWVIVSITVFGGLWGAVGMFVGAPLFSVFYNIIKRYINSKLKLKQYPINSELYDDVVYVDNGKFLKRMQQNQEDTNTTETTE